MAMNNDVDGMKECLESALAQIRNRTAERNTLQAKLDQCLPLEYVAHLADKVATLTAERDALRGKDRGDYPVSHEAYITCLAERDAARARVHELENIILHIEQLRKLLLEMK